MRAPISPPLCRNWASALMARGSRRRAACLLILGRAGRLVQTQLF